MIEQILQIVGVELFIAQQIEDDSGVEVARARPHRNATCRSEAHRSIDRFSVSKGTETSSVPQMSKNSSFWKGRAEVIDQRLIRNTVETIASNPGVEIMVWQGEVRCTLRSRLMKSIVETGEMCSRRKDRLRGG